MRFLLSTILAICVSCAALAEERVLRESSVGQGGLICDTADEAESYLTLVKTGTSAQEALDSIQGCGILVVAMRMRVVAVKTLKDFYVVRYDFLDVPLPPQYGLEARKGQDA